jgi:hypothetical protein
MFPALAHSRRVTVPVGDGAAQNIPNKAKHTDIAPIALRAIRDVDMVVSDS